MFKAVRKFVVFTQQMSVNAGMPKLVMLQLSNFLWIIATEGRCRQAIKTCNFPVFVDNESSVAGIFLGFRHFRTSKYRREE